MKKEKVKALTLYESIALARDINISTQDAKYLLDKSDSFLIISLIAGNRNVEFNILTSIVYDEDMPKQIRTIALRNIWDRVMDILQNDQEHGGRHINNIQIAVRDIIRSCDYNGINQSSSYLILTMLVLRTFLDRYNIK